jgi:hypothetical protein
MILPFPDRTNSALAQRIERHLVARERGTMLFQLPAPEMPDSDQLFMLLYLRSRGVFLGAQKSTDPRAFILLKHFTGTAKNIAAEVIEVTLKYIEPRFCDYSHEIQFGEIGEGDELTWRLIKNEELGTNVTPMNRKVDVNQ